jgi:hypothetical protein
MGKSSEFCAKRRRVDGRDKRGHDGGGKPDF